MDILGTDDHGSQGQRIIRPPIQRLPSIDTRIHLPPTLFNVVMDAIIRHWVTVVVSTKESTEGLGMLIGDLVDYFYADDGLVASNQP